MTDHEHVHQGEWEGWYVYPPGTVGARDKPGKQLTNPILFFLKMGVILGNGVDTDSNLPFSIEGLWTRTNVSFIKSYPTYKKIYDGAFKKEGNRLEGTWHDPDTPKVVGAFALQQRRINIRDDHSELSSPWVKVLTDQMGRAYRGEPSIFGIGEQNLVWKNLSSQEIFVIYRGLEMKQYETVLKIYYNTYRLAIQIADDSERNAKRHAFWQIALVNAFGVDFAKKLGDAHEKGRPGHDEDNMVDEFNNKVATSYALAHKGTDPHKAADLLWANKQLRGYGEHHPPYKWTHEEF